MATLEQLAQSEHALIAAPPLVPISVVTALRCCAGRTWSELRAWGFPRATGRQRNGEAVWSQRELLAWVVRRRQLTQPTLRAGASR